MKKPYITTDAGESGAVSVCYTVFKQSVKHRQASPPPLLQEGTYFVSSSVNMSRSVEATLGNPRHE